MKILACLADYAVHLLYMNCRQRHQHKILARIGALALLFLLISVVTVQAFHQHGVTPAPCPDGQEQVYAPEICKICDYCQHKQKDLHTTYPPALTAATGIAQTLDRCPSTGFYEFTLQGFTNKGPPAFIA